MNCVMKLKYCVSVRVYILDPAALTTSSQALSIFLALWRRGAGHITVRKESNKKKGVYIINLIA